MLVQPKTVIVEEHSQVQLLCQLLTHNQTTPIPNVTFNWLYQSVECFQGKVINQGINSKWKHADPLVC